MQRRFIILVLLFAAGNSTAAADNLTRMEWNVDGVAREALVYAPATAKTDPSPVVFAFHGHGGTMRNAARTFNYEKHWPEALVVYMQGLPTPGAITDPDGRLPGWQKAAGDQGDRDLKFFDEVLATLKKEHKVDDKRIFATGHSNGGGFTYLLWATRGDTFAAVAPAAAGIGRGLGDLKPKPALHVAGEKDELVPFAFQSRMMAAVRKLNGCATEGKEWAKSGTLVGTIYASKTGIPFVSLIYPGTHKFPPEAPELIVKFLKECVEK